MLLSASGSPRPGTVGASGVIIGLDISFSTRAITREAWQGVGVEVVLQVALWTLASSRTGDKHDRWPELTVAERLVWEQCNVPLEGSQKSLSVGQGSDFSRGFG